MTKDQPRNIRFPSDLLEKLQQAAEVNHRSLQNEIIFRLSATVDGETIVLNKSAAESLDKLVERIGLDRTTLASAAVNHYELMAANININVVTK